MKSFCLILLVFAACAWADNSQIPQAFFEAFFAAQHLKPAERATAIAGGCVYKSNWCPGAKVTLFGPKGEEIKTLTISAADGFQFLKLNPDWTYDLEVSYD